MSPTRRALIVIDLQNDYFPGGSFPQWNADAILANVEVAIGRARAQGIPVVVVQHVAGPAAGSAPFFNEGTAGAEIHPRIRAAAPDAPVVVKRFADAFHQTTLESTLSRLGVREMLVCGMMTQNCVTHTVLSRSAQKYEVSVLADCCTTVNELLHKIALRALSTSTRLVAAGEAL
jgi:nicotinamidase-related amidase